MSVPSSSSADDLLSRGPGSELSGTPHLDALGDALDNTSRSGAPRHEGRGLVTTLVQQVLAGETGPIRDIVAMISSRIAQIDYLVSAQLNPIMHAPGFQQLEAAWRGLYYLTRRTGYLDGVKIRFFNASKRELYQDFEEAPEFRLQALWSKTVDQGLETLGAEPFSILVGDYSFGPHPGDQALLSRLSKLGAAAHSPFLAAAAPAMFGVESFSSLPRGTALNRLFATGPYMRWHFNRRRAEAAYCALVVPPVLMRRSFPEAARSQPDEFQHRENSDNLCDLPWGSPVWALAAQLASSFSNGSWCAELHAREDGGVIRKLPSFEVREDEGDIGSRGPTQVSISDDLYSELRNLGLVALCSDQRDGRAVFFETPTLRKLPEAAEDEEEEFDPPPLNRLEYVLAAARVAQYVKCMVREKRSSFSSAADCELYLNSWAAKYTVPEDVQQSDPAAQMPFLQARFRVIENDRPVFGNYKVEGEVLPNLRGASAQTPLPVSVGIVLPQALPAAGGHEHQPAARGPVALAGQPASSGASGSFAVACDSLERLTELRRKQLIEEPEFQQLRNLLLRQMNDSIVPPRQNATGKELPLPLEPLDLAVPYAELHSQIVDRIAAPYRSGEDAKHRAYRSMSEMAEKQALYPGDSEALSKLIDLTLTPQPEHIAGDSTSFASDMLDRLAAVNSVSALIGSRDGASPAAKAIAGTAQQSATRAHEQYQSEQTSEEPKGNPVERYWRRLVWPDVEGAFSGGAAATAIFPALSGFQMPLVLPMIAAFGVVIGAGVRSGVAHGECYPPRTSM